MSNPYESEDIREQDAFLPSANVQRLMKMALPPNAKISKEAKDCIQECVSEFIMFVTSEATDRCQSHGNRKTITGEDIVVSMSALGFDPYIQPMQTWLEKLKDSPRQLKSVDPLMSQQ